MDAGTANATDPPPLTGTAAVIDGAPGTVRGTTAADAAEYAPVPAAFTAATLKKYPVPFARPDAAHDTATDETLAAHPAASTNGPPAPADRCTLYPVTGDPPDTDGADHDTTADPSPGTPATPDGTPGTVRGVTPTAADAAPSPAAFTARTRTSYPVPFTRPVIASGLAADAGLRTVHDNPPSVEYA